jgi:hypothetical protein
MMDVGIAFVLASPVIGIMSPARGRVGKGAEDASYRAYRVLIHGSFAMLMVFFLLGDRVVWANCLTGFAWWAWLLLYTLPGWLTALAATRASVDTPRAVSAGPGRERRTAHGRGPPRAKASAVFSGQGRGDWPVRCWPSGR